MGGGVSGVFKHNQNLFEFQRKISIFTCIEGGLKWFLSESDFIISHP